MNIDFYASHTDTLADLIKIAEKHDCKITFGFFSSTERTIDEDILERSGLAGDLVEEMNVKMTISDASSSFDKVWFELFDKNTKTHNTMAYIESSTYFSVEKDGEFVFRCDEDKPSESLIEWLEEHDEFYRADEYIVHESYNPTIIHGFGNKERVEDYRVYRSGMALKFFGDLVCDYLNEPRINRVY